MADQPVTRETIEALAAEFEAAGKDYHEIVERCDDPALLRQTGNELLVRAMGKDAGTGLLALVRDEYFEREMSRVADRQRRKNAG